MKGIDQTATNMLEQAAEILCGNDPERREFLQMIYDLGVNDGALKEIRKRIERMAA